MDRFLSLPSWEIVSDLFPQRISVHSVSTYIEPPGGLVDVGLGLDDALKVHVIALLDPQGVKSRAERENSLGSDCNNTFECRSRSSPEASEQEKFCLIFDGLSLKSVQYYFKDINLSSTKWRKKISAWGRVETTGAAVNRLCVLSVDCVLYALQLISRLRESSNWLAVISIFSARHLRNFPASPILGTNFKTELVELELCSSVTWNNKTKYFRLFSSDK